MDEDELFTPEDMTEMMQRFRRVEDDTKTGYLIELHISRAAAREMVETWLEGLMGNKKALSVCFDNYSYLVEEIMQALQEDDESND